MLVVEKVNGMLVELERERLQKGDVISEHLFVGKVKLVYDDGVDVVVAQQVVKGRFVANVFKENVERLQELDADELRALLLHVMEEKFQHVLLEKEVEDGAVVLVAPNQDFRHGAQGFDQRFSVRRRHRFVFAQDAVEILEVLERMRVLRGTPQSTRPERTESTEHGGGSRPSEKDEIREAPTSLPYIFSRID